MDHEGLLLKDLEDIVEEVIAHFTETFRMRQEGDQNENFRYFLCDQDARIPDEAREHLESFPTQENLHGATMCLNKL